MSQPRRRASTTGRAGGPATAPHAAATTAVDALVAVAPLVSRWIERLLAGHEPPLTIAQLLALRAIADDEVSGGDLAQRTGVSGPAVSQLLSGLDRAALIERRELSSDRRRQVLALSEHGKRSLRSAQTLLRRRLTALLAELPRPEADALARALPHVEAMLSGTPPPRPPTPPPPREGPGRKPHRRT